ncbi:glycosyltransferase [Glycomyces sp. TRM65418]|uniref:glycosyltransferase n=1 Tax=Glycomyces sp. TRM65418 TaxID=2867006 RepID=UPI001CE6D640|nr:glycosyltransferase [Glycomyces sp. TRM65418]MCC3762510.1 glycosyltransferase [Glycomyces sp. TRM65418]QZD56553.1 glycosyltransferase [Glycomyces sp. TRM65418]
MEPSIPGPAEGLRAARNDSGSIVLARLGAWTPRARVSVVVPAFGGQDKLDLTLAALAAQTYPASLLEVVVVDDGSEPPLRLPDLRPADTRLIPNTAGTWGIAAAVATGIGASTGEVVVRLDSDVVPAAAHIEAHARWHHLADYFTVVGKLAFADIATAALSPERVRSAVAGGDAASLFAGCEVSDDWEIALVRESGGTVEDPVRAFTVANGATISFTRAMYEACGGMDTGMRLGSDTELGYRLAQHGALFIADGEAEVWHLGYSQMKSRREEGKRYRRPFAANRIPSLRHLRTDPGRSWEVPYVRAVVDADGARLEPVRATVNALLAGTIADIEVVLTGPWDSLTTGRVAPLEDPLLNLRLIREAFRGDGRVRFLEKAPETVAPVPFQLFLDPGAELRRDGLERLVAHADEHRLGRVDTAVPAKAGPLRVRLDRTAALARAERLRSPGEDPDALLDALWGVERTGPDAWFLTAASKSESRRREIAELKAALARLEDPGPARRSLPRRALGRLRRVIR